MVATERMTELPFVYPDGTKMGAGMRQNPIGHYQVPVVTTRRSLIRLADTECPYCHERLWTPKDGVSVSRVLREVSRDDRRIVVVVADVPATHRALVCLACKSGFTTVKS